MAASHKKNRFYEFGEFRLDARERVLLKGGQAVDLPLKALHILIVLVENSGRLLEKEELMNQVWGDAAVEEANLKNRISLLRKALDDPPQVSRFIQTLPRRGYKFVAPVTLWPDEDEVYLVEKQTTAEIVIDEIEVERKLIASDEGRIETDLKEALPASSEIVGEERTAQSVSMVLAAEQASARQGEKRSFIRNWSRTRKAAAVSVLLIVTAVLSIGLYKWMDASKQRKAFLFDKMKMTRLTNVGNTAAIISPDGKYIAYFVYGTSTDGLWVRQTATDSAIKLLSNGRCWGLTFTPDSNYVYCNLVDEDHPEGVLYKIPALGGPAKLVLEGLGGGVSFSPDGKRMVFRRADKEMAKPMLITANIDGSDERIILPANSRYTIWQCDWSPNGKTITLVVINHEVEGQHAYQVIEIPADGGEERPITSLQKEFISSITWLPDNSGLIMTAADKDTGLWQLWHLSYPSGQATRITNDSNTYFGVTVTSDGGTILAGRLAIASNIWIADAGDLNNLRKITADWGGDDLGWTLDGRIVHSEGDSGKSDLWIMNADGTGRQRLTDTQSQDRWPSVSPDGRYIVFSSRRSGNRQLWRIDSDGRNLKQLTGGISECITPKIAADGQWVAYLTWIPPTGWGIKKIPINGGEPVLLAERAEGFAISPDGSMLAYEYFDEQKKRNIILVKPMDGGEPVKILDFPDFSIYRIEQWTRDGLLSISAISNQIILVPVDGSQPRQSSDFKTDERIFSFAVSPDGRHIAFSRGTSSTETVMITEFEER